MDKHYGWQEGRGSQVPQGRPQNGQRWNERYRDDDRDMRSTRSDEYGGGWDRDDRQWTPSGGNLDREDYVNEGDEYGRQRGSFRSRGQQWTQSAGDQKKSPSRGKPSWECSKPGRLPMSTQCGSRAPLGGPVVPLV